MAQLAAIHSALEQLPKDCEAVFDERNLKTMEFGIPFRSVDEGGQDAAHVAVHELLADRLKFRKKVTSEVA